MVVGRVHTVEPLLASCVPEICRGVGIIRYMYMYMHLHTYVHIHVHVYVRDDSLVSHTSQSGRKEGDHASTIFTPAPTNQAQSIRFVL